MYTSERQYDLFKAKEIINQEILPQQRASQICMYTSFFKRQRQYDTFKRKKISIEGLPAERAYIAFLVDFHFFLQDQANSWQTDLC